MPEISRFNGIIIQMYYREHPPPHFHVIYAGQKAVISIRQHTLTEGELPKAVLADVIKWAKVREPELLDNWDRARGFLELKDIEGL